jgi:hypothetical protein
MASYVSRLGNVLHFANHIIFADPHIDPERPGYAQFGDLLKATFRPKGPQPLIEIHRVCYTGSGTNREIVKRDEWERRFRDTLDAGLKALGLTIEVFVWDDDHERYVISDLLGLHLGNGFDTTKNPKAFATWTRLSASGRDAIQRLYDPNVRGRPYHRFTIGGAKK